MFDDLFYPKERKGLWTKEMILLSLSNFFLYISLYIFLPSLPYWLTNQFGYSLVISSIVMASFAIAIFIPGPFNNYLLDAFKRKKVAFWSFVILGLSALGYLGAVSLCIVLALRIIQGILFSIITTTTSSTLLIDITPTNKRTIANLTFTHVGRSGMMIGVVIGIYLLDNYEVNMLFYISAALTLLSCFTILFIRVPFRAPLKPSFFSLDRFLLPRVLPAAVNMISTPIILGILITMLQVNVSFLSLALGFTIGFILMHVLFKNLQGKAELELSTSLIVVGCLFIMITSSIIISYIGYVLLGTGLSIAANRFYVIIISMPLHCERGSANNTYNLIWELGILIGIVIGFSFDGSTIAELLVSIAIAFISLLLYEFKIHKWYYSLMDNK